MKGQTVDELRGQCRKRGLYVSGNKSELLKRLKTANEDAKSVFVTNRNGQARGGERSICLCSTYLASGNHRHVFTGPYTQGPRQGQQAVKKVFKTGSVFEIFL